VVLKLFWFAAHCKTYKNVLANFVYKIKNILIYLYLVSEENPNSHRYDVEKCIKMDKACLAIERYSYAPRSRCLLAVHNNCYPRGLAQLLLDHGCNKSLYKWVSSRF
jgi:hypothetical protein